MKLLPGRRDERVRYLMRLSNVLADPDNEPNPEWATEMITLLINELRVAWGQLDLLEHLDEQGRTE